MQFTGPSITDINLELRRLYKRTLLTMVLRYLLCGGIAAIVVYVLNVIRYPFEQNKPLLIGIDMGLTTILFLFIAGPCMIRFIFQEHGLKIARGSLQKRMDIHVPDKEVPTP
jgi:hypothetical protein